MEPLLTNSEPVPVKGSPASSDKNPSDCTPSGSAYRMSSIKQHHIASPSLPPAHPQILAPGATLSRSTSMGSKVSTICMCGQRYMCELAGFMCDQKGNHLVIAWALVRHDIRSSRSHVASETHTSGIPDTCILPGMFPGIILRMSCHVMSFCCNVQHTVSDATPARSLHFMTLHRDHHTCCRVSLPSYLAAQHCHQVGTQACVLAALGRHHHAPPPLASLVGDNQADLHE
jgi:hypothetical protein